MQQSTEVYAFQAQQQLAKASLLEVALMLNRAAVQELGKRDGEGDGEKGSEGDREGGGEGNSEAHSLKHKGEVLLFDVDSGRQIDLDVSGSAEDIRRRYREQVSDPDTETMGPKKRRGRPKLGVVGKEVTLLPRHWEWLEQQRGGASATLRRLIDQARKALSDREQVQQAQDAAQRFMTAMAGDLPGYEEAVRALYAGNGPKFREETARWPADIRRCAGEYAEAAFA